MLVLQHRHWREYNTDPQRRCYYGVHARSEWAWTEWGDLWSMPDDTPPAEIESKLKYMRDLNEYAVSERGESAKTEYRIIADNSAA